MELRYLSPAFYSKYKNCPEIMSKGETRPYIILIIETENNKFAIPIRKNLHKTKDCYESNPATNSGLDYTKALVITRDDYIDITRYPEIDHKEFNYIKFKEREIKIAFSKFVQDHKKDVVRHIKNPSIPENPRFKYCTLQYFKKELGIE
ncbi:MAG: hypothetical protein MR911_08765 [Spirochaetia bacterium]|nr:hypothetical protein [Spirochaetia bacterium]